MTHSFPKYKILDQDFFKQIDTEQKAYILGLLWADGHNDPKKTGGTVSITICEPDDKLLYIIKDIFYGDVNRPIYTYDRKKLNPRWKNVSVLSICSKIISHDLLKLGMKSNKTYDISIPNCIPDKLLSHFVRGMFDGDGHFTTTTDGDCTFGITCNIILLHQIQEIFSTKLKLKKTKLNITNNPKIGRLRYGGIKNAYKIYNYLYNGCNICMERKLSKFVKYFADNISRVLKTKTSKYERVCFNKNRNNWVAKNKTGIQKRFPSEYDAYLFTLTS